MAFDENKDYDGDNKTGTKKDRKAYKEQKNKGANEARPGPMDNEVVYEELPRWLKGMIETPNPNFPGSNYHSVVQEGIKAGWFVPETWSGQGEENFLSAIKDTDEYRANNEATRKYLALEVAEPEQYQFELDAAKAVLQREAAAKGYALPGNLDDLARQYLYQSWNANPALMQEALSAYISEDTEGDFAFRGDAGDAEQSLKYLASQNGIGLSDGYFSGAVRAISSGLGAQEDYEREIREMAAGKFPQYSDRILGGENARDLASGYIAVLADTFEMDTQAITLDNEWLMKGLMGGAEGAMNLWDYRTLLRNSDYWINQTQEGRDTMVDVGTQVLEKLGFIGTGGTY